MIFRYQFLSIDYPGLPTAHDKAMTVPVCLPDNKNIGTGQQNYFNPATNDVLERFVEGEIWTIIGVIDQL